MAKNTDLDPSTPVVGSCLVCGVEVERAGARGPMPKYCKKDRYPGGQGKSPAKAKEPRGRPRKVTEEMKLAFMEAYNNERLSLHAIGRRYGVSYETVRRYVSPKPPTQLLTPHKDKRPRYA